MYVAVALLAALLRSEQVAHVIITKRACTRLHELHHQPAGQQVTQLTQAVAEPSEVAGRGGGRVNRPRRIRAQPCMPVVGVGM